MENAREVKRGWVNRAIGGRLQFDAGIGQEIGWYLSHVYRLNYQYVNARMVKDAYPVASMDAILDKLRWTKYNFEDRLENL